MALAARSSAHPAIAGPRAPSLEFVDSQQADGIDLTEFGSVRTGPVDTLSRQAVASFLEPSVAQSELGLQASILVIYLFSSA